MPILTCNSILRTGSKIADPLPDIFVCIQVKIFNQIEHLSDKFVDFKAHSYIHLQLNYQNWPIINISQCSKADHWTKSKNGSSRRSTCLWMVRKLLRLKATSNNSRIFVSFILAYSTSCICRKPQVNLWKFSPSPAINNHSRLQDVQIEGAWVGLSPRNIDTLRDIV